MALALYDVIGRLYPYMVNLRHRSPAHLPFKPSVVRGSQLSPYEMKDYSELFWSKELQYGAKSLLKKVIYYTLLITLLKSDALRYLITLKKVFCSIAFSLLRKLSWNTVLMRTQVHSFCYCSGMNKKQRWKPAQRHFGVVTTVILNW